MLDAALVAEAPIHSIGSGPAMAPVAGRHDARLDAGTETAVVADTGGTSYDVSLVRRGRIPWTRETWLGGQLVGHSTGFPSVDVRAIGAGGGGGYGDPRERDPRRVAADVAEGFVTRARRDGLRRRARSGRAPRRGPDPEPARTLMPAPRRTEP